MDFIVTDPDPLLDAFFDNFASLWSRPNQAEGFRAYVLGLVSEAHRKNVQALSAKTIGEPYQSLHHFLAEAPWDTDALNDLRLGALMADRRTAPRDAGILIVDDSGVPKKGHATEGVKRQYIGQLGKTANGQVFVTSHYADTRCHWPVDLAPYVSRRAGTAGGQAGPGLPDQDRPGPGVGRTGGRAGPAVAGRGGRQLVRL